MIMEVNEMILIETLKDIEPALKEYFAYNRTMLYTEIERMYLATWGFMGKVEDKYMIEVPNTLENWQQVITRLIGNVTLLESKR